MACYCCELRLDEDCEDASWMLPWLGALFFAVCISDIQKRAYV